MAKYIKVYESKEKHRMKEIDYNNFNLGLYILRAFNSPKDYPKKPFTAEESKPRVMDDEEMKNFAKRFTKKLNGEIINGNKD